MEVVSCGCEVCQAIKNENFSEYELHMFVGMHKANRQADLIEFESDLIFGSVTHWDIGFCGVARYYIYRDDRFNAVAWYDVENRRGYK